jgi:RNA polymerase sigma-70 factor (ECF subfamily)
LLDIDTAAIEAVRKGEVRRYAEIVDRHKDRAMTLALRLLADRREAEETVQDGFLRAYHNIDQFRGDAKFGTWFYRILYNLCMTRVARRRNGVALALDQDVLLEQVPIDADEPTALEKLESDETGAILAEEMDRLPEKWKLPLTLFYVQEMRYEEIAAVLGLPVGTVKTNLYRGRSALKARILARLGEEVRAV